MNTKYLHTLLANISLRSSLKEELSAVTSEQSDNIQMVKSNTGANFAWLHTITVVL